MKRMSNYWRILTVSIVGIVAIACGDDDNENSGKRLELVANSSVQWTGVAVSNEQRIFVNYPNWSETHTNSVAEITDTSVVQPFPDQAWNTWSPELNPADHFICVQSVFVDNNNFLWILDPANPQRNGEYLGVVTGGAKLLKVDLTSNAVVQKIIFNEPVIEKNSYLNDIRIDEQRMIGYITDSNEGALVVVDLNTGAARRVLAQDPSTKSGNEVIRVENEPYRNQQGEYPIIHADGIALNPDRTYLYWRALTSNSMHRLKTELLNNPEVSDADLSANVEDRGNFPPSDGMIFGDNGKLYLTSIEQNGVRVLNEGDRSSELVTSSEELKWPDSFAVGPDGMIYVTTSQIHIPSPTQPYKIFKFKP